MFPLHRFPTLQVNNQRDKSSHKNDGTKNATKYGSQRFEQKPTLWSRDLISRKTITPESHAPNVTGITTASQVLSRYTT
jgi:hypothetical protein